MSYRLSFDEPLPKTLNATALELFDHATGLARDELADDPVTTVHAVRKDIKKARSLLRLVRPAIPAKVYRRGEPPPRGTPRGNPGAGGADGEGGEGAKLSPGLRGHPPPPGVTPPPRRR